MRRITGTVLTAALIFLFTVQAYSATALKPFPQSVTYPYGIKPNNFTQAQMNQHVQDWFVKWRAKYVTQNNCTGAEWRLQRTETGNSIHKGCPENDTVSEGIGYGMLVLVYMENATNNTKAQFDGMYTYYKNHLDGAGLMNWQIPYCDSGGSATDADEDVAMALLAAEWQWGNATGTNYGAEATTIIGRVLNSEITATNDIRPGDGWDGGNISYFAPYEYRMFATKTGQTRWNTIAQRTYQTIVNYYYNSALTTNVALGIKTGLQPNWCNYDGTPWSPGAWAMRADTWWWDAIRHAWRQGYDYVLYGTSNHQLAYDNSARLSYFFKTKYSGDASLIKSHYTLDGTETTYCRGDRTPDLCTEDVRNLPGPEGAVAIAAMAEGDQAWLNECYYTLVTMNAGTGSGGLTETGVMWGTDYFCDILKMQYLLILTGNMPNPMGDPPTPTVTRTPTFGPSPTPVGPGIFDDFETGALLNPDTSESNGTVLTISNSNEQVFSGTRALKGVNTGGTWSIFSIDSPYTGGLGYRNYTGATAIEFDIYCPAGKVFFVEIEEGTANGADGERFSNRGAALTKAGSGWSHISITLSGMTRDTYSPVMGNNVFNLGSIVSFLIQFENPGTMNFYVDNVQFTGTFPTITPTRTATRTRTPAGTLTITPTRTASATNTPYFSATITRTSTVTPTETLFISSTVTRTGTITPTWTASPYIPADIFDDFETAALKNPSTADTGGGSTLVLANSGTIQHAGARSMSAVTTGGGWAVASIDSPYDGGLGYRDFTGATGLSFWIYTTAATGGFVKIVENNGQQWSNRGAGYTTAGTGWQQINITLSALTVDAYSPAGDGDAVLDLNIIKSVQFQWDNPGAKTIYIDDIRFTGIPTPTITRTGTRTRTISPTPTYTRTGTLTSTPTRSVTCPCTYTVTHTFTPSVTRTAQNPTESHTPTVTYTASGTGTVTRTVTLTITTTVTRTSTASPTSTRTPTGTYTGTPPSTFTFTRTVTPSVTETGTQSPTRTHTLTHTATFTATFTPTFTVTHTPTFTITRTHTVSPTITPSWTGTPPTSTFTPTVTETWTVSATPTVTRTFTPSATPTFTGTPTSTFSRTVTPTFTGSVTRTSTATPTVQDTDTPTYTVTATRTATPTYSVTVTGTPSISPTHSVTGTITPSWTGTPPTSTYTPTVTPTWTVSASPTRTASPTMTVTRTLTPTHTYTVTSIASLASSPTLTSTPTWANSFTMTITITITSNTSPTFTATPTATTVISGILEIKDAVTGPNPYRGTGAMLVGFTATRPCSSVTFKIFTNAFRLVRKIDLGSCSAGPVTKTVTSARLAGLGSGTYFCVIEGASDNGSARSSIEKLLIMK